MDILIFLVILNASFVVFSELGIFGAAVPGGRDVDVVANIGGFKITLNAVIIAFATAVLGSTVILMGSRASAPIGVAVVAFSAMYGFMLAKSWEIMSEFRVADSSGATIELIPSPLLAIFVIMNLLVFVIAMIQMVTGGWEPYK